MADKILLRRGNKVDLPALLVGEPGFATDTKEFFIGAAGGNAQVAMAKQPAWIAPTLLNGWVNYGSLNFASAGYMKDTLGFVHIKGIIKSGTITNGTTLFTLPIGYRPAETHSFIVSTSNGSADSYARIDVNSSGAVVGQTTLQSAFLSLSILPFLAEQ